MRKLRILKILFCALVGWVGVSAFLIWRTLPATVSSVEQGNEKEAALLAGSTGAYVARKPKKPGQEDRRSVASEDDIDDKDGEEIEDILEHAASRESAYLSTLAYPDKDNLFVSVENQARIRSRQPFNAKLVPKILPNESPRPHFETCAVVGNSGILKRSSYGALIDLHDAVFRLNQAPVAGYESLVGSRTTFRLLNHKWTSVYYEDNVPNTAVPGGTSQLARFLIKQEPANATLVVARSTTKSFETLATTAKRRRPDIQTLYLSSRVVSAARRSLLVYRGGNGENSSRPETAETTPSTGFIAMFLAMQCCKRTTVYGFSLEESRYTSEMKLQGTTYHYFKRWADSEQLRAHAHHSFNLEGNLILALNASGQVKLCGAGSRSGPGCGWTMGAMRSNVAADSDTNDRIDV